MLSENNLLSGGKRRCDYLNDSWWVALSLVGVNGKVSDESGIHRDRGIQLNQFQMVRCIGKAGRTAELDTQLNVHF